MSLKIIRMGVKKMEKMVYMLMQNGWQIAIGICGLLLIAQAMISHRINVEKRTTEKELRQVHEALENLKTKQQEESKHIEQLWQQMEKDGEADTQQGEAVQKEKTWNRKQEQLINEVLTEVFQG